MTPVMLNSKTLCTAIVVATLATGCTSTDAEQPTGNTGPTPGIPQPSAAPVANPATAPVWSTAEFAGPLPLDEYFPTGHDLALRNKAGAIAVNLCLAERGIQPVFTPITPQGITDSHSDIFGYLGKDGAPNTANYPKEFASVLHYDPLDYASYEVANATPTQLNALGGAERAPDGCLMKALNSIHPDGQKAIPPNYQNTIRLQVDAIVAAETEDIVQTGRAAWAECMTAAGHTSDPMDPYTMNQVHEGKGAAAEADLRCKKETNMIKPWRDVLETKHKELLAANKDNLVEAKKYLTTTRAEIDDYLKKHS